MASVIVTFNGPGGIVRAAISSDGVVGSGRNSTAVSAGTFGPPAVRSMRFSTSAQDTNASNTPQRVENLPSPSKNFTNIYPFLSPSDLACEGRAGFDSSVFLAHFGQTIWFCLALTTENFSTHDMRLETLSEGQKQHRGIDIWLDSAIIFFIAISTLKMHYFSNMVIRRTFLPRLQFEDN
jgi:hypothetical protein